MAPLKKLKPVLVEWMDIVDGGGDWQDKPVSPVKVKTVGYIYKENKNHLTLIRDYLDLDGKRTIGGCLAIPMGCIHRIINLIPEKTD